MKNIIKDREKALRIRISTNNEIYYYLLREKNK